MTGSKKLPGIILIAVLMFTKLTTTAQVGILNDSIPNQLDIFKVNPLLLGLNEARFMYEMELKKTVSAEFGVGIIYPHPFWINIPYNKVIPYDQIPTYGDRTYLASGGGIYLAMRKYIDKKKYFYQPPFRSYLSLVTFYRYSQYGDKWLGYVDYDRDGNIVMQGCYTFNLSENFHQLGIISRVGWQKTTGKFVLDFYTGMGVRYLRNQVSYHAFNDSSLTLDYTPNTEILNDLSSHDKTFSLIVNLGLNIGIRRNNRERNYGMIDEEKEFEKQPEF